MDGTMHFIGGKWKTVVLWYLRKEKKRFSELKRLIPNITEKMLSLQLKDLEKDGIVGRKVYPEIPRLVEYFLTDFGQSLIPMLEEIARWGCHRALTKGKLVAREPKKKLKKNLSGPKGRSAPGMRNARSCTLDIPVIIFTR